MQTLKDTITILMPIMTVFAGWIVSGRQHERREDLEAERNRWQAIIEEQRKTIREKDRDIETLKKERDAYSAMLLRKENNHANK